MDLSRACVSISSFVSRLEQLAGVEGKGEEEAGMWEDNRELTELCDGFERIMIKIIF